VLKTVTAYSGSYQCVLDMSASEADGALIFDITGITEDSREISVDKLATRTVISSIAPKQRIIVMSIRITDVDVETRRKTLSSVFKAGNSVRLVFETDIVEMREIRGVVESCNNPVFTKESTMVVTLICPDSVFYAEPVTVSLDPPDPANPHTANNPGDVPSGCTITITLDGTVATGPATITHASGVQMSFDMAKVDALAGGIAAGDVITVDSGYKKRCTLSRTGSSFNIFSAVSLPYTWIQIAPDEIDITLDGFGASGELVYSPGYGGL